MMSLDLHHLGEVGVGLVELSKSLGRWSSVRVRHTLIVTIFEHDLLADEMYTPLSDAE